MKTRSHSVHGHTFAPLHHHRSGSSVTTMRHAVRMTRAPVEEMPGGNKVTEYPINKYMDHPYTGYLILLAILAALFSILFLR